MKSLRSLAVLLATFLPVAVQAGFVSDGTSAFYQEHTQDAINWEPWGPATWKKAADAKKPIYVFAGSYTSELSRAMRVQSFVNPQIIKLLNEEFICVLVDKDERPDLASAFQAYLSANKQMSGWPANLWFSPSLKPFDGSTYLPPSQEWGKEGILNVLQRVLGQWKANPADVEQRGAEGLSNVASAEPAEAGPDWNAAQAAELAKKGAATWLEHYDAEHTGFGDAPRFQEPELLRALLHQGDAAKSASLSTLKTLATSPLHDVLAGGFFKRVVDSGWELPSFQKFTADQGRVAHAFLDAASVSSDPIYLDAARSALTYLVNTLQPDGLWARGEDGTFEELAPTFSWTEQDIADLLGDRAPAFQKAFGVTKDGSVSPDNDPSGKWKGKNLLRSSDFTAMPAQRALLLAERNRRGTLKRDPHAFVCDNALAVSALARGSVDLKAPQLLDTAKKVLAKLVAAWDPKGKTLVRQPGTTLPAGPEDYVTLAAALAAVDSVEKNAAHADLIAALLDTAVKKFYDPATGRFFAASEIDPSISWRTHVADPVSGEPPSPETTALLVYFSSPKLAAQMPPALSKLLMAQLDDPSGQPRGDVLLAAHQALKATAP